MDIKKKLEQLNVFQLKKIYVQLFDIPIKSDKRYIIYQLPFKKRSCKQRKNIICFSSKNKKITKEIKAISRKIKKIDNIQLSRCSEKTYQKKVIDRHFSSSLYLSKFCLFSSVNILSRYLLT